MYIEVQITELGSKGCGGTAEVTFESPGGLSHIETFSGRICGNGYARTFEAPDDCRVTKITSTGPLTLEIREAH